MKEPSTEVLQSHNRRKPVAVAREMVAPKADVLPLDIEEMVIRTEGFPACHFKRLRYTGCPNLSPRTSNFPVDTVIKFAGRDEFVRDVYVYFNAIKTPSVVNRFYSLIEYLRWLDNSGLTHPQNDCLHHSLVDACMTHCADMCAIGEMSTVKWSRITSHIRLILRDFGHNDVAKTLPVITVIKSPNSGHTGLHPEDELRPISRLLFKAFNTLVKHFEGGTSPAYHPIYDADLVKQESNKHNRSNHQHAMSVAAFKQCLKTHPYNPISQVAMMICYMFTGMNMTPLANMKIRDVSIKSVNGGYYIFNAEKARASHLQLDNAMGFSKNASEFIEKWKAISLKMSAGDVSAPLFPYYTSNGSAVHFSMVHKSPQQSINRLLLRMGLKTIDPSKLRKTKSDILMRITEDVFLVSTSLNNQPNVTKGRYAYGQDADHIKNLSASMNAKYDIASGFPIEDAVTEAKYKVADILDTYEYERLRSTQSRSHESRTPLGIRCKNNSKGASKLIEKALIKAGINDNDGPFCTDFLACFECAEHALVADTDDIWLMLSFKDTLVELKQVQSVNSLPKGKYVKLYNTIEFILKRFKETSPINFKSAKQKHQHTPHPL